MEPLGSLTLARMVSTAVDTHSEAIFNRLSWSTMSTSAGGKSPKPSSQLALIIVVYLCHFKATKRTCLKKGTSRSRPNSRSTDRPADTLSGDTTQQSTVFVQKVTYTTFPPKVAGLHWFLKIAIDHIPTSGQGSPSAALSEVFRWTSVTSRFTPQMHRKQL